MSVPAAAAKGPLAFLLRSQTGQWMTVSLGAIYAFPEQAKLVLGDLGSYATLAKQMSGFTIDDKALAPAAPQQPSIIIHQVGSGGEKNQITTLMLKVVVGGSACWIGYMLFTNALPEYLQEFFPVTRKFFSKTSKFLVNTIEQVKLALEEKIQEIISGQDDLSKKLDGTQTSVDGLHKELGDARNDLDKLGDSMARQESTLSSSHKTMSYTSKGVTLLVRCVASMLPTNDRTVHDLAEYIKDGEEIKKHEQKQEQQRRISDSVLKTPVPSVMSTPIRMSTTGRITSTPGRIMLKDPKQMMIRESRADDDMESLEDVHSVLGIKPGHSLLTT